jgi:hypothetical protein
VKAPQKIKPHLLKRYSFRKNNSKIQRVIIHELEKVGIIHLYTLGFRGDDLINFKLALNNPSKIAEMQEIEFWKAKFDIAASATEGYFSRRWVTEHIFGMSNEEFVRNQREIYYDRKYDASLQQVAEAAAAGETAGATGGDLVATWAAIWILVILVLDAMMVWMSAQKRCRPVTQVLQPMTLHFLQYLPDRVIPRDLAHMKKVRMLEKTALMMAVNLQARGKGILVHNTMQKNVEAQQDQSFKEPSRFGYFCNVPSIAKGIYEQDRIYL